MAAEMFNRHRGLASLRPITSPVLQATPDIKQGLYRIDHHSRWARCGRVYLEPCLKGRLDQAVGTASSTAIGFDLIASG